jgi:TolA-binding protein
MKLTSRQFVIALKHIAAFMALLLAAHGCAYYNTFYNTKKTYKAALEEQKKRTGDNKPTPTENQNYDKTIEKASKLLQIYPDSKYVDDALMILGECFYYKQEYLKAQRKFQELITIFPKSSLVPRAQIWLARTNLELDDYAGTERVLKELQQRGKKDEFFYQAQYFLGEIYFRQQKYIDAAQEFEVAIRKLGDEKLRGEAFMRLGECCIALKQFDLAAGAFRRASSAYRDNVNFTFQARLNHASALKNDSRFDEALVILNGMLKEFSTHRDLPLVKLEIAECATVQGKIESAIRQYTSIVENHQRTEASAAAFFALGDIYETQLGDFPKAKESFDNVRRENARSEKVAEADRRSKAIGELIKLKEAIVSLQNQHLNLKTGGNDSLGRAKDSPKKSSSGSKRPISRVPDRKSRRTRNAEKSPTASGLAQTAAANSSNSQPSAEEALRKIAADLAQNKILLAELYLFHFNRPDSAMREYLDVFEFFPETEYAPQALFSLAYIMANSPATLAMRDSILHVLADKYSHTAQGQAAKRALGRPDTVKTQTPPSDLIHQAENNLLVKKDPKSALRLYQEFLQRQPDSNLAPQSLYAIGWIYEHELADNKQALVTYKKLIETFPNSPQARQVRPKVTAVEQKTNAPSKPEQPAPVDTSSQVKSEENKTPQEPVYDDDEILARKQRLNQNPQPPVADEDELKKAKQDETVADEESKDEEKPPPH